MSILDRLNDEQKKAATQIDGPLLILAGAGSGKTGTITHRIAHMIKERDISPYKILAVTFTNKAAKEMRERVESLIGENAKKVMLSTFHAFAVRLLRVYGEKLGYGSNFTIYDTDDQKRVIKNIMKDLIVTTDLKEGIIVSIISKLKENEITVDKYEKENRFDENYKLILECYKRYTSILKLNNGMDFSDILTNLYELLKIDEILEKLQDRYQYVMVDEYQDTNDIQYKIVTKIAEKHRNICVVGDENQSIYGFRGANIKNILDFEKQYPDALIVKLEENYRSTSNILNAANEVIKNNKSSKNKNLWTKKTDGEKITLKCCKDAWDEVYFVIEEIIKRKNKGLLYKDFTILYRTNSQSRVFEEGLRRYNIPYKIFGGMQFYQRMEIKDILAYLMVINNPKDNINLNRIINVPKRKIGAKTLEKISDYANVLGISMYEALGNIDEISNITSATKFSLHKLYLDLTELIEFSRESSTSEIFDLLLDKINYFEYLKTTYKEESENRIENVKELKNSIIEMQKIDEMLSLRDYLESVSLVNATDDLNENTDYVKLMTIHNSKGLEFPVVFLVGIEDEFFPGTNKVRENESELEEERRLCYVAITRAEQKLYICYTVSRVIYGQLKDRNASRFIDEIPISLVEQLDKENKSVKEKKQRTTTFKNVLSVNDLKEIKSSLNLPFNINEQVEHSKFGLGRITNINKKKVEIEFVCGKKEIATIVATKFLKKL